MVQYKGHKSSLSLGLWPFFETKAGHVRLLRGIRYPSCGKGTVLHLKSVRAGWQHGCRVHLRFGHPDTAFPEDLRLFPTGYSVDAIPLRIKTALPIFVFQRTALPAGLDGRLPKNWQNAGKTRRNSPADFAIITSGL